MSGAPGDRSVAGYPSWAPRLVAVPPVFFAVVSLTDAAGPRWIVAVALGIAVVPWLIQAARPGALSDAVFVTWVVAPIAMLHLAGPSLAVDLSGESHNQFSLMVLVWLVGEMAARSGPRVVLTAFVALAVVTIGRSAVEPEFGHAWGFWLGGGGVAFITGYLLRRQQQTLAELRETQAVLAGEAARRERQRIAREIHDVVAHTLTVTLLHLQAARRALDRDPGAVDEALREAETLGRRSLADVRRTVGLLRAESEGPDVHALPDASDLPALLESYRAAGMQLRAEVHGDLGVLAPASGLTLYRVVQEALSNAAGHTDGAPVDLRVTVGRREVSVTVSNPVAHGSSVPGGGLGIVGMRERVGMLGGELAAGTEDGAWTVTATFPRDAVEPPAEVRA